MVEIILFRLKGKYPLIRMDLTDTDKQLPIFDNFYIDFNALVYQCIKVIIRLFRKATVF